MKRLIAIVVLISAVLFSSAAMAEDTSLFKKISESLTPLYDLWFKVRIGDKKAVEIKSPASQKTEVSDVKVEKKQKAEAKKVKKAKAANKVSTTIKTRSALGPVIWDKHGANPHRNINKKVTKAELIADVKAFKDLSDEDKKLLIAQVLSGNKKLGKLAYGDPLKEMHSGRGIMGSGRGVVVGGRKDVLEPVWYYEAIKPDGTILGLFDIWRCGNTSWGYIVPIPPIPPTVVTPPPEPPKEIPPIPPTVVTPPPEPPKEEQPPPPPKVEEKKKPCNVFNKMELYVGIYHGDSTIADAHTTSEWWKARWYPFEFSVGDNWKMDAGIVVGSSWWQGNAEEYEFNGRKIFLGPSLKLFNNALTQEVSLDLGYAEMYNRGGVGEYRNKQTGTGIVGTLGYDNKVRRKSGKKWFPRYGGYFDFYYPLTADVEESISGKPLDGKPSDDTYYAIGFQQSIIDIKKGIWRFTPGLNVEYSHHNSIPEDQFKTGLNLIISAYDYDILNFNPFNPKWGNKGTREIAWDGYWSIGHTIEAYRAHRIRSATDEDIEAIRQAALEKSQ